MAQAVARMTGVARPEFMIEAGAELGLSAARWHIEERRVSRKPTSHHILVYHAHAGVTMAKLVDGVRISRTPRRGAVTLVRATDRIEWSWDRPLDVIHLYIHPESVSRFGREHLGCAAPPLLHDFFGIEEPWLAGYFQILVSEREHDDDRTQPGSSRFLAETEPILLRHLIQWHSDIGASEEPESERSLKVNPLRQTVMRRVEEHVQLHLADVIHLPSLAALANMSVDHFLRSFHAAAGTTPYQYVLEMRLAKACRLLRETVTPIATVAAECGFHSASHFSVSFSDRFGMQPSQYRRRA